MKIWKTEEEAALTTCFKQQRPVGSEYDYHACLGRECGHWLPRKCLDCHGEGLSKAAFESSKERHVCRYCKGTGHDGSNLGRCGLVHL